jgi:hypothetical protein
MGSRAQQDRSVMTTSARPDAIQLHLKRTLPAFRLLLYYAAVVAVATVLIKYVPGFRDALVAPIQEAPGSTLERMTGSAPAAARPTAPWPGVFGRGALTATAILWALAMAAPVVWVLMRTRRLRYDPSLVNTLIVLPIVVAGVVLIVKNSLALAFALAGIVAGVRFRQSLEEPEEAVYVLLALGIGLAAGVQALDIALVMSMAFNFVVLTIWRYDIGDIYAKGKGAQLAIGDPALFTTYEHEAARAFIERDSSLTEGMKPHGMLVVRAKDVNSGRRAIETVVAAMASEWRISQPIHDGKGPPRLHAVVRLKDKIEPAELVAELEARWSEHISAAVFVPLSTPTPEE